MKNNTNQNHADPESRSIPNKLFGAILSGRLLLLVVLLALAIGGIAYEWKSTNEYWFSLAVELGAGTLLFLCIQNVPQRTLNVTTGVIVALLSLGVLAIAYNVSSHLQSLLIELGAGAFLFLALEVWFGKLVLKKLQQREEALVEKVVERLKAAMPNASLPDDFDMEEYLSELRDAYKDWQLFSPNLLELPRTSELPAPSLGSVAAGDAKDSPRGKPNDSKTK